MGDAMTRISNALAGEMEAKAASEGLLTATRKSFVISADVAHSVHPNYAHKHDGNHQPKLNAGTVLKTNDNQRYATDAVSGFFFREISRLAGEPCQEFVVRNDCGCGTTIGPIIAGLLGVRTVDVGVASLSMHSIRETIGVADVDSNYRVLASFFANFDGLLASFTGF